MIFSPNGEPLSGGALGFPACPAALGGWFDRLDLAHRGALERALFLADAARQFQAMDLDHDGILTPEVLTRYRAAFAIPLGPEPRASDERKKPARGQPGLSAAESARDVPDPVMAADTRLRLQVSADEFLRHAGLVFDALDADHDGSLSRAEALAWCGSSQPSGGGSGWLDWLGWF